MPATHAFEHHLTAVLQRNMQMRAKQATAEQGVQPAFVKLPRLQGADTKTRLTGKVGRKRCIQRAQKIPEVPQMIIATAILSKIDAGNHDFNMSGFKQSPGFGNNIFKRAAVGATARQGDDTVGATVGTAVLYLEHGTRTLEGGNGKWRKCLRLGRPAVRVHRDGGRICNRCGGLGIRWRGGGTRRAFRMRRQAVQPDRRGSPRPLQQDIFMLLRDKKVRGRPCRAGARLVIGKQARRTTRKNEAGLRCFAPQTKNGIAGVSLTLGCDGATVDADNVSPGRGGAFHAAKFLPCLT